MKPLQEPLPLPAVAVENMFKRLAIVHPLDNELKGELKKVVRFEKIKRGTLLLKPGDKSDRMYYIHKGLLRCYYYKKDENGNDTKMDVSTWFMREGDVCVSVESYYTGIASYEYIVALEPCELFWISREDSEEIYRRSLAFNYIGRVLTRDYLVGWARQLRYIRLLRAEERYAALCDADADLVRRVPLKYIASYLDLAGKSITRARGGK